MKELLHSAHLTKTQKIIAEYVLDNASEACFMTSTEIALKLGVSESSVIRFSRTIGFDGFMDFQKALRKDYQDKVLSISSSITVPSQRIAKQAKLDTSSDYINWHFKNAAHNLEEIFIQNSIETFEQAADLIVSSKHKYIAATRGNICLADFFLLYLKQMVPHVTMTTTTSMSPIDHMCNISHTDCLVLFSFPRYSSQDEVTAEMAHDAGASIIVITDKPSSLLAKYADILLTVPVDSNTFFNSMIGPQFVTEALLEIISHRAKGIEKRLNIMAAPYERMAIKRACDKTFICFFTSSFLSLSSCQFHSLFLSPEIIRNQTQQCPSPCKRIADQQNFHLMMDLRKNHDPRKSYKEQSSKRKYRRPEYISQSAQASRQIFK